jgi:membrane protein DedA with SNARE-associated domain
MEHSLHIINDFLDQLFAYGPVWIYLALFIASFIENIFPPFPGDLFTLTGGALAASGRLDIITVFFVVYLGGIGSVMLVYYLGYHYGRDFFVRKNYRAFSADDILRLEAWFIRRGAVLLLFNRFIVGTRSVVALITGISRFSPMRTFTYVSVSFWLFNGLLLFSSYVFVINFETIIEYYKLYERIAWPIIILAVAGLIIYKFRKIRQRGRKS